MDRKELLCLLEILVSVFFDMTQAVANTAFSPTEEHVNFPSLQIRPTLDPRPRLSSTQQQQILNDVQQHQHRYNLADFSSVVTSPEDLQIAIKSDSLTTAFPSLAKYRVDRTKQLHHQPNRSLIQTTPNKHYFSLHQNFPSTLINSFNDFQTDISPSTFPNSQYNPYLFNDESSNSQLQAFYEKQRELELLRKQREQLILEQQELRRQQEVLRLEQRVALTSTTLRPTSITRLSTTPPSILLASPKVPRITPAESEIFLKAIATHQKKFTSTTTKPIKSMPINLAPRKDSIREENQEIPKDLLSLIQAQNPQLLENGKIKPQIRIIYPTENPLSQQISLSVKNKSLEKDQLLRQLKLALAESSSEETEKNVTTRDLVLPNGRKLQVIEAPNGLSSIVLNEGSSQYQTVTPALDSTSTSTTTVKPVKAILDELTKGILPPGADFEVLRQKGDGKLEQISKMPIGNQPGKKVTFVVLEEQSDGSYKVQGVKGNAEKETDRDIESIVKKIKTGELKLPPSLKNSTNKAQTTERPMSIESTMILFINSSSPTEAHDSESSNNYSTYVTVTPKSNSSDDNYVTSASTPTANHYNSVFTFNPTSSRITTANYKYASTSTLPPRNNFIPMMAPVDEIIGSTTTTLTPPPSSTLSHSSSYVQLSSNTEIPQISSTTTRDTITTIRAVNSAAFENLIIDDTQGRNTLSKFENSINQFSSADTIASILRREGLYAMAKYLRQSGLDTVLNETGPYTIFAPTDKAFKALLVQLGGPEKAEQKFRENPRLLSGLLLHHVIPGAFQIDSLQEEMTGVSLAGTQLRVNVYDMHDHEWNDVQITTINGAKVSPNKKDIEIPQGIIHSVDRVMFPLPVGDLMQTLAADREQRFGMFLRLLHVSGIDRSLSEMKTFTVFAPTDTAFATALTQNGRSVWSETDGPEVAKAVVSRHIIPTTLYTAGMRFYHHKETLHPPFALKIQKNAGRIRVNEAQVITHNVPATNGVIHAIDAVL